jgi:drug/metabolite transporter (DMT)-like permease
VTAGNRSAGAATWAALSIVYVVWGSTYLSIRVLDRSVPPLLGMGARFLTAGLLLAVFLAVRHGPGVLRVPPRRAAAAALTGVLLLAGGNGAVAVAEQAIPSGLAALLVAAVPLWLVCLRLATGDRPRRLTGAGTLLGFAGIAVLTLPGSHPAGTALWGVLVVLGGSVSWAAGSFMSQRLPVPRQPFVATAYEMLAGGAVMLAAGAVSGEGGRLHLAAVPVTGWLALGYLVLFGSLVAFSAYVWLLGHAPLSLTATYAYVNPVVAVLLGAAILGEQVTWPILLGGAVVVAGVGLVVSAERPRRAPAPPPAPPAPRRAHTVPGARDPGTTRPDS